MWDYLGPAIVCGVIFGSFVLLIKIISDNRIRREVIASGKVDENVKYLFLKNNAICGSILNSIKWGLVLVAIGLAFILGLFFPYRISDEITFGLMFIFSGIALLIYYFFAQKKTKDI